jgi:hypothetical protein
MTLDTFFTLVLDPSVLVMLGIAIFLVVVLPAFHDWRKTVRCPNCRTWFRLEYQGFEVRDKVVGHSSTRVGGGFGNRLFAHFFGGMSRTKADPFIREWGTAHFMCKKCGCIIQIDTKRDK